MKKSVRRGEIFLHPLLYLLFVTIVGTRFAISVVVAFPISRPPLITTANGSRPTRFSSSLLSSSTTALLKLSQQQTQDVSIASTTTEDREEDDVEGPAPTSTIESNMNILYRASETKDVESDIVVQALIDLEKLMRVQCRDDYPTSAQTILQQLNGDWRLIFTTGTIDTQEKLKGAKINYFPIKAIQSFRPNDKPKMTIENGIYIGNFNIIKFSGIFDFDLKKRKLEFDFTNIDLLNFFNIKIKSDQAAEIGASTGLGSKSNIENTKRGKRPFFNWISANEQIATARGGGGGLALWKRVT